MPALSEQVRERSSRWSRWARLSVIVVVAATVGTFLGIYVGSSTQVAVPAQVRVTDIGALRNSIATFVTLSKIDRAPFSVTTEPSPLSRRWQYFTVTWADSRQQPLHGFGYWQYGSWSLADTGFANVGCGSTSGHAVIKSTVPIAIVHSFGLRC